MTNIEMKNYANKDIKLAPNLPTAVYPNIFFLLIVNARIRIVL